MDIDPQKMKTNLARPTRRKWFGGFSLIELLTVILVISILMTVGVIGIRNLAAGKSTASAVASTEALFDEARLIAVGRGTTARVLVNVDTSKMDSGDYLRRVLIAYRPLNADGTVDTSTWELANRGMLLPDGVYFSREFSSKDHAGSGEQLESELFTFTQSGYSGRYVFYEFNSEGISTTPGASFIIGSGVRPRNADKPRVTGSASRDFSGFVIWRSGRTSIFRSPDQMELPATFTEF